MEKELISFEVYVRRVDGADLLEYLPSGTKWTSLTKIQQLFIVIIIFGAICGALTAIKIFLFDSVIPTTRWVGNMTSTTYYGITVEQSLDILFYIILVLIFSIVTYIINRREQDKTKKAKDEADQWRQKAKDEELRNQTEALASKIFKFLGDRGKTDPSRNSPRFNPNLGESERHALWEEENIRNDEYSRETRTIYNTEYLPEVVRIRQEFVNRNLIDAKLEMMYSHPVNTLVIQEIAVCLHKLAAKLP